MDTEWRRQVLDEQRVFRANGPVEMKAGFADHGLMLSLGLAHARNVPVLRRGCVAWTLNLLRAGPAFSDAAVARVQCLLAARGHA
jgi:hypothetical protein